jgi:hypothetical protein
MSFKYYNKIYVKYSGSHLMGSLWGIVKLITLTDLITINALIL